MTNPTLARVIPFALYMLFLTIAGTFVIPLAEGDARLWYPLKIIAVVVALAVFWRSYEELHRPSAVRGQDWLLACVVGVAVFVVWINLDQPWAVVGTPPGYNPTDTSTGQIDARYAAIRWLGATLVVPVMEELFWRSFMLRWCVQPDFMRVDPLKVSGRAFMITAALFAVEHHQWLAGLLAGCAYNWLYIRSGKLWVPITAHAVTNGLLGAWVWYTHQWQFW